VLGELTRHAISAWLADLAETSEASTVATRLRGMRRFCRWLVAESDIDIAPTDGIEIPEPPEKPVPILTDHEIAALLKACAVPRGRPGTFDRTIFLGRRDEAILRLLLDPGPGPLPTGTRPASPRPSPRRGVPEGGLGVLTTDVGDGGA
jgi:site-specific recombinase XerD